MQKNLFIRTIVCIQYHRTKIFVSQKEIIANYSRFFEKEKMT